MLHVNTKFRNCNGWKRYLGHLAWSGGMCHGYPLYITPCLYHWNHNRGQNSSTGPLDLVCPHLKLPGHRLNTFSWLLPRPTSKIVGCAKHSTTDNWIIQMNISPSFRTVVFLFFIFYSASSIFSSNLTILKTSDPIAWCCRQCHVWPHAWCSQVAENLLCQLFTMYSILYIKV